MSPEAISIAGLVLLLLPTLYFFISSPTFLLAKFKDSVVTKLFRDLLSFHFKLAGIGSAVAFVAMNFAGKPWFATGMAVVGTLAAAARHWFLQHVEKDMQALDAGDTGAVQRLRSLHWRGMAYNALQIATLIATMPFLYSSFGLSGIRHSTVGFHGSLRGAGRLVLKTDSLSI